MSQAVVLLALVCKRASIAKTLHVNETCKQTHNFSRCQHLSSLLFTIQALYRGSNTLSTCVGILGHRYTTYNVVDLQPIPRIPVWFCLTGPVIGIIIECYRHHILAHSSISFLGTRPERPGLEMLGDIPIRIRDGQNAAVLNVLEYGAPSRSRTAHQRIMSPLL